MQITASNGFVEWLSAANLSIAFTTYRKGKIFLMGRKPGGHLSVFERTFNRSMGIWSDTQTMWLGSAFQIWRFENMLPPDRVDGEFDRLYVPQQSSTTGDIDIHDLTVDQHGRLYFVSSRFCCVGALDDQNSLESVWHPPFVTRLVPEDRCHLNGICCVEGKPRYVTACSQTDTDHGWRERKGDGGCVIDMESDEIVADGLSMPHSPRYADGKLWLLNSGRAEFGYLDTKAGKFEPVAFCPGFARGLALLDRYAIVGLSKPRDKTFKGLELDAKLERHNTPAICGLAVIDIELCKVVHQVHVTGDVEELYDVAALPGVKCPKILGLKTDEIQHNVWLQSGGQTTRFTAVEG